MEKPQGLGGSYRVEKRVPEVQDRLQQALEKRFGDTLTPLLRSAWKYGLCFQIKAEDALSVFKALRDEQDFQFSILVDVSAVDWLDKREPRFDVVYQLLSHKLLHRLMLKIQVDEDNPQVDSLRGIWQTANFLEREVWDMYGISFEGHGDLRRILLYDEFEGHPLRKDYPIQKKQPRVKLRVPEQRNDSADMNRSELVAMPTLKKAVATTEAGEDAVDKRAQ